MAAVVTGISTTTRFQEPRETELCGWQRRVDALCDLFEDAWHDGKEPRIDDYLATCDLPPSRQGALLCELLKSFPSPSPTQAYPIERKLRSPGPAQRPGLLVGHVG